MILLLCLSLLLTACSPPEPVEPEPIRKEVIYQGETYVPRKGITSLLVMGLDKFERDGDLTGYINHFQADFLMLVVIDEQRNTVELLHLNRDTMTEIRRLGIGGGVAAKFQGQLALAHTYGSGGSDSSLNAVKAVSTLLGGVTIDHYLSLTMDAVGVVNDLAGGVTVTVLDDFSQADPTLEQGKEITLKGEQALTYVRTRMNLEDSTNLRRMERQRQYLTALYDRIMEKQAQDENFLANALLAVSEDFLSDCTLGQLEELAETLEACAMSPIRHLKGEAVKGEEFIEFYLDEEDLLRQTIELFYQKEA